jgi:hypothetical protein
MLTASSFLVAGLLASTAQAETSKPAEVAPVKDQRALTELKQMGDALSAARTLSFDTTSLSPLRGPNNQWVHVLKTDQVKLQRPNQLFIKTGGDSVKRDIFFDGKTYSVYAVDHKLYSQETVEGSVDDMLAKISSKGGDTFAFADVLLADPYASWSKSLEGAVYVGQSERQGEKLTHIALTEKGADWEVFIDNKTHLPRIVYVKYTDLERSPAVLIEFSKWKINAELPPSTFAFKAPSGAKKAPFKAPQGESK